MSCSKSNCNDCKPKCHCANACCCDTTPEPCEDLNLDADKSWVYVTTDTDCGTDVKMVSLRCLKQFMETITNE